MIRRWCSLALSLLLTLSLVHPALAASAVANDDSFTANPGETVTGNVLLNDSGSGALTAAKATDPMSGSVSINADGSFTYTPNQPYVGTDSFLYQLKVDGSYAATGRINITYDRYTTTISDVSGSGHYGKMLNLQANFTSSGGSVRARSVRFSVNGQSFGANPPDDAGLVQVNWAAPSDLMPGTYDLVATFPDGDTDYAPSEATGTLTVSKVPSKLSLQSLFPGPYREGHPLKLYARLQDADDDHPQPGRTLSFQVDGVDQAPVTLDGDGQLLWDYTPTPGSHTFTVASAGDATHDPATDSITLDIAADAAPVAQPDTYSTTVNQAIHRGPTGGVLDNDSDADDAANALTAVVDQDPSHGTLVLDPDGTIHYTPTADFVGTDTFTYHVYDGVKASEPATVTITVDAVKTSTFIMLPPESGTVGQQFNLWAGLWAFGDPSVPLAGEQLTLYVDGAQVCQGLTDASGNYSCPYTDPATGPVSRTLKAEFAGDAGYNASNQTNTLTINPAGPPAATELWFWGATAPYGTDVTLEASLVQTDWGGLSGKTVTFSAGTWSDTDVTDSDGIARVQLPPEMVAAPGVIPVTVTYAGDSTTAPASQTADVTLQGWPASIGLDLPASAKVGEAVTLKASVTVTLAGHEGPAADATLSFRVNSREVGRATTGPDGTAQVSYTPATAGTRTVTVVMDDPKYELSYATATLTIEGAPAATTLTVKSESVPYATEASLEATLTDSATGAALSGRAVRFAIGGWSATATTNADGIARNPAPATYMNMPGTLTVTAAYDGDSTTAAISGMGTLTLTAWPTVVQLDLPASAVAGQPVQLGAVVTDTVLGYGDGVYGASLTFRVDGTAVGTATTDDAGFAQVTYTPTAAGAHTVEVTFGGTPYFQAASATGTLPVPAANHPPVMSDLPINQSTKKGKALTIPVATLLAGASDADGDPLHPVVKSQPAHGRATVGLDGSIEYVPSAGYVGTDTFTYVISDGQAESTARMVKVKVESTTSGGGGGGGGSSPTPAPTTPPVDTPPAPPVDTPPAPPVDTPPAPPVVTPPAPPAEPAVIHLPVITSPGTEIIATPADLGGVPATPGVQPLLAFTVAATDRTWPASVAVPVDPAGWAGNSEHLGLFRADSTGRLTFVGGRYQDSTLVVALPGPGQYVLSSVNITFPDLAGHWVKADAELMAAKQVIQGRPDGRFDPDAPVTRAEFAAMLVRALGLDLTAAPATAVFGDVQPGSWYYQTVQSGAAAGIIRGYDDSQFHPNDLITREEVAAILMRALRLSGKTPMQLSDAEAQTALSGFLDSRSVAGWARGDVAAAFRLNLLHGDGTGNLLPGKTTTRAEAAALIARFWRL